MADCFRNCLGDKSATLTSKGMEAITFMANQPTPPGHVPPPKRNKGLMAGLKGNQWLTRLANGP